jgi:hypothetical protein
MVRESLLKKIIESSNDPRAVVEALEKYDNEKATAAYLCEHTPDVSIQRSLIGHVKKPQLLAKITEHECALEIAEAIVSQMTDKECLERIAQRASNKKIRIVAQEKIDTLFADPQAREREIAKKLRLCCTGMDIRVSPHNYDQAVELLEFSRKVWNTYDPQRGHPLADAYAAAEKALIEKIRRAEAQKQVLETLETICLKAEQLADGTGEAIEDRFEEFQTQWKSADRAAIREISTVSLDERFKTACAKIASIISVSKDALERTNRNRELLEQACGELERFADDGAAPDEKTWRRLLSHWDALTSRQAPDEEMKKRFEDADKKYRNKIEAKAQRETIERKEEIEGIERLVAEMESIARTTPHASRSSYLQAAFLKKEWDRPRPLARVRKAELQAVFTDAYEGFMSAYHELREQNSWRQWANDHAKATILEEFERMETGLRQGDSLRKIARKISLLESRWRQASGVKGETGDWDERFSAIRDRTYSLALTKKTELLESLKAVLARSEEGNRAEEIKSLQVQWNDIGYLPPELEKDHSDTFYGLCNAYFEQRKEHHRKYAEEVDKNVKIREEICAEAVRLSDATDWKATKDAFAQLQERWDESWPAPHKKSHELWVQFCKSRDHFFERYHAFQAENDERKEELCGEAEKLLARLGADGSVGSDEETQKESVASDVRGDEGSNSGDPSAATAAQSSSAAGPEQPIKSARVNFGSILGAAVRIKKSWMEIGPGSKERSEELWRRFNGTLRKVFAVIEREHGKNFAIKESLVKEAEAISLSDDWEGGSARLQEIRDAWKATGPTAHRDEQELWRRLQTAADTFFGRRKAHYDSQRNVVRRSLEEKENLIAELEILVRLAGKSNRLKTSPHQSAAEVLKKGIDLRNLLVVDADPEQTYANIKKRALEIIDAWEGAERMRGRDFYELEKRFDELIGILKRR